MNPSPCMVCREPGTVAHYPGPISYTGSWCKECENKLAAISKRGVYLLPDSKKELDEAYAQYVSQI